MPNGSDTLPRLLCDCVWVGSKHFCFKSIIDKLILLFLSVWRACLSNTEIGRFFQGEIEFPVYFFLLPTFDVNLFRLNSTFPQFDSKHIPFPAPDEVQKERTANSSSSGQQFYLLYCHHYLYTPEHRTHKNNKMSNYCYRKTEQSEGTVDGYLDRTRSGRPIIARVASPGHNFGHRNNLSLLLHRRNFADGF